MYGEMMPYVFIKSLYVLYCDIRFLYSVDYHLLIFHQIYLDLFASFPSQAATLILDTLILQYLWQKKARQWVAGIKKAKFYTENPEIYERIK